MLASSAYWATRRNVFFSPWPPIMIGGPPGVTGPGPLHGVRSRGSACRRRWGARGNIARQIRSASSEALEALLRRAGSRTSSASCSTSNQAAPMPRNARPAGDHVEGGDGLGQERGVAVGDAGDERAQARGLVRAASAPSSVYASNISCSGGPSIGQLEEVVHHEDGVEAALLGGDGDRRPPARRAGRGPRRGR